MSSREEFFFWCLINWDSLAENKFEKLLLSNFLICPLLYITDDAPDFNDPIFLLFDSS